MGYQMDFLSRLDQQALPDDRSRDDMNLVEVLLGIPKPRGNSSAKEVSTPWEEGERSYRVSADENSYRAEWEGQPSDVEGPSDRRMFYRSVECNRGLPGPHAEDVIVALLKLTAEKHFEEEKIEVTCHQLLDLMRWGKTKYYYDRLRDTLHQLVGMSVHTNAIYNPTNDEYVERAFNIFSDMEIDRDTRPKEAGCYVRWAKGTFELFEMGFTKPLDTSFFYSLEDPLAKRMYRWLDKHLRRSSSVEIDVMELAHKILGYGLSYKYPSQVTRKLKPKLDLLNEKGFCRHSIVKDREFDSGSKFVFQRVSTYTSVVYPTRENVLSAMTERQVYSNKAEKLLDTFGWECCLRQVEHLDYKTEKGDPPENPGGWLTRAISHNQGKGYELPEQLRALIEKARDETKRWCAQSYQAMSETEREKLKTRLLGAASPAARKKLANHPEEVAPHFFRLRNQHLLIAKQPVRP